MIVFERPVNGSFGFDATLSVDSLAETVRTFWDLRGVSSGSSPRRERSRAVFSPERSACRRSFDLKV